MAGLEQELGHRLFHRTASGLMLTAVGETLIARAEEAEGAIHGLLHEAHGHDTSVAGVVRLALTESVAVHIVVPTVLPVLRERHPDLRLELLTNYRNADLSRREADLALRFERPAHGELTMKRLVRIRTAVLANRAYARRKRRKPSSFDWVELGIPGVEAPESAWLRRHVPVRPRYWTSGYLTQVEMVRAGLGVALLSRALMRIDPELIELDLGLPPTPTLELWLVGHPAQARIRRIAVVRELLEECLQPLAGT